MSDNLTPGLTRAAQIIQAEIARAELLMTVEEGGQPLFDAAQTDAGICALQTVLEAIQSEAGEKE